MYNIIYYIAVKVYMCMYNQMCSDWLTDQCTAKTTVSINLEFKGVCLLLRYICTKKVFSLICISKCQKIIHFLLTLRLDGYFSVLL